MALDALEALDLQLVYLVLVSVAVAVVVAGAVALLVAPDRLRGRGPRLPHVPVPVPPFALDPLAKMQSVSQSHPLTPLANTQPPTPLMNTHPPTPPANTHPLTPSALSPAPPTPLLAPTTTAATTAAAAVTAAANDIIRDEGRGREDRLVQALEALTAQLARQAEDRERVSSALERVVGVLEMQALAQGQGQQGFAQQQQQQPQALGIGAGVAGGRVSPFLQHQQAQMQQPVSPLPGMGAAGPAANNGFLGRRQGTPSLAASAADDGDLYRRKVEAMEGLARVLREGQGIAVEWSGRREGMGRGGEEGRGEMLGDALLL